MEQPRKPWSPMGIALISLLLSPIPGGILAPRRAVSR